MYESIDKRKDLLIELSDNIWEFAELGLQEYKSADAIATILKSEGFDVVSGLADMPTSIVAEYGSGKPIISFLGEYDALPGMSQKKIPIKDPVEEGRPGHGCGHNLLGVGSVGAAIMVKDEISKGKTKGTVRYYGCPAEELLVGKVFMVRAGLFNDVDCALTWHPYNYTSIWALNFLAMNSVKFNFHGKAAHAAADPYNGRSALDAVELMNVSVNYLREHVPFDVRIHYVITNGGVAPNIVPDEATVWYFVRAPRRKDVENVYKRMIDCADGAAKMTETTYDIEFLSGCYDTMTNDILESVMIEKLKQVGIPAYTPEELDFASTLTNSALEALEKNRAKFREQFKVDMNDKLICDTVIPIMDKGEIGPGSTDVGDVSHVVPTAQCITTCSPLAITTHSWQFTACAGMSIGHKGMLIAAKTLGLTGLEVLTNPNILLKAKEIFDMQRNGEIYTSPLPDGIKPNLKMANVK